MADNENNTEERGPKVLKNYALAHKIDIAMLLTRMVTTFATIGYFIPLFWNPYTFYYKALLSTAASNCLRLHQRLPRISFTMAFLQELLLEDSFHYFAYCLIFLYVSPITMVLLPVFLFALLHTSSYSLILLDLLGPNAWWAARLLISLVEFQSRNILRLVSFTEICLLPFTVLIIFFGRGNFLTPLVYYQFLCFRYASRRNPYSRNMFHDLRVVTEEIANKPAVPGFIKAALLKGIAFTTLLAPRIAMQEAQ